jgi:hypothetical protein
VKAPPSHPSGIARKAGKAAPEAIRWDRSLFATGPDMSTPCPEVLDVTGRHRVLVFGPMLPLPAGRWRLAVRFSLSREAAGHDYILQFIHGAALSERRFRPTAAGLYEVDIVNAFAQDAVAALRLWNGRALFQGELRFNGARVTRLPAEEPAEAATVPGSKGVEESE